MTDTTTDATITDLPFHTRTVSADTAQLREDLEMLRGNACRFETLSRATTLSLIDRLLSIVERLEDRMLRR
jgi:hypothetical protein